MVSVVIYANSGMKCGEAPSFWNHGDLGLNPGTSTKWTCELDNIHNPLGLFSHI